MAKKDENCCGKTVTETTSTTTKYGMAACEPERGTLQYIGARYVPIFATPVEWDKTRTYEHLMMVQHEGGTYISRQAVPVGVELDDAEYWVYLTAWNAQIEQYRQEVESFNARIEKNTSDIDKYSYPENNPIYYGADPTGVENSAPAINDCIAANQNGTVVFSPGTYRIESPIVIPYDNWYSTYDFNGAYLINETELSACIQIGFKGQKSYPPNAPEHFATHEQIVNFKNLHLYSESVWAIDAVDYFQNLHFDDVSIVCSKNGVRVGTKTAISNQTWPHPADSQFNRCYLCNTNALNSYIGIKFDSTDNKVNDCRIYAFQTGIECLHGGTFIDNVHFFLTNTDDLIADGGADNEWKCIHGTDVITDNCYCDSYPSFIKCDGGRVLASNLKIYSNSEEKIKPGAALFNFIDATTKENSLGINGVRWSNGNYPADSSLVRIPLRADFQDMSLFGSSVQSFIREFKLGNRAEGDVWVSNPYKLFEDSQVKKDIGFAVGKDNMMRMHPIGFNKGDWCYVCSIPICWVYSGIVEVMSGSSGGRHELASGKFSIRVNDARDAITQFMVVEDKGLSLGANVDGNFIHLYATCNDNYLNEATGTSYPNCVAPYFVRASVNVCDFVSAGYALSKNAINNSLGEFAFPTTVQYIAS